MMDHLSLENNEELEMFPLNLEGDIGNEIEAIAVSNNIDQFNNNVDENIFPDNKIIISQGRSLMVWL